MRHSRRVAPWRLLADMLGGVLLCAAMLSGFHAAWIYWGNGLDGIHRQQEIARGSGPVGAAANAAGVREDRIARPMDGDPPVEAVPAHGTVLGWMRIPRFGPEWERAIQQGTDLAVLDNYGIGHYSNTVMPGAVGNSAYAGHRTPGDLGPADRLRPGDAIVIRTADYWYVYETESSWQTTPDDVRVLDSTGGGRMITLTTCKNSLSMEDSLSARFIVRGRFEYWARVADGIPKELATPKRASPAVRMRAAAARVVRDVSVRAPVSRFLFAVSLASWALLAGACALVWRRRPARAPSLSPMVWSWRLQSGPVPLRAVEWALFWLAVMFAQWAWLSPWLASLSPVFAGSAGTPMMG